MPRKYPLPPKIRHCRKCGVEITGLPARERYCSRECQREARRAQGRVRQRQRTACLQAQELCRQCGDPAVEGKTRCAKHLAAEAEPARKREAENRRASREAGTCAWSGCDTPSPEHWFCTEHRKYHRDRARDMRSRGLCEKCGQSSTLSTCPGCRSDVKRRIRIRERDSGICQLCGRETPLEGGHVDHILPRSKGGTNEDSNLQWLCAPCNLSKWANIA